MCSTYSSARRHRVLPAAAALTLFAALGCQNKPVDLAPTQTVSGRVVYTDGRPVSGGTIEFAPSPPDPSILVTGVLDNDGRFTLSTIKGKAKVAGVVEGRYQVTIVLPIPGSRQSVSPLTLPDIYTIKAGENALPDFQIPPQHLTRSR